MCTVPTQGDRQGHLSCPVVMVKEKLECFTTGIYCKEGGVGGVERFPNEGQIKFLKRKSHDISLWVSSSSFFKHEKG